MQQLDFMQCYCKLSRMPYLEGSDEATFAYPNARLVSD